MLRVVVPRSAEEVTDLNVRIRVPWQTGMLADFADIRFFASDGVTPLAQYRQAYTASTAALWWVKIPLKQKAKYYVYIDFGTETELLSSGSDVFLFYDSGSDAGVDKWTTDVESYLLTHSPGSTSGCEYEGVTCSYFKDYPSGSADPETEAADLDYYVNGLPPDVDNMPICVSKVGGRIIIDAGNVTVGRTNLVLCACSVNLPEPHIEYKTSPAYRTHQVSARVTADYVTTDNDNIGICIVGADAYLGNDMSLYSNYGVDYWADFDKPIWPASYKGICGEDYIGTLCSPTTGPFDIIRPGGEPQGGTKIPGYSNYIECVEGDDSVSSAARSCLLGRCNKQTAHPAYGTYDFMMIERMVAQYYSSPPPPELLESQYNIPAMLKAVGVGPDINSYRQILLGDYGGGPTSGNWSLRIAADISEGASSSKSFQEIFIYRTMVPAVGYFSDDEAPEGGIPGDPTIEEISQPSITGAYPVSGRSKMLTAALLDFTMEQGVVFDRTIVYYDENDNPVDLTAYSARMSVRINPGDATAQLVFSSAEGGAADGSIVLGGAAGTIRILATSTVTAALDFDRAFYDLELSPSGAADFTTADDVIRLSEGLIFFRRQITVEA